MKLTMKRESLVLLRNCLSVPGQAKTVEAIFKQGRVLVEVLPELDDRPNPSNPKEWKPWSESTVDIEVADLDLKVCQDAFQFALEKEAFGASIWSLDLQKALKLGLPS